MPLTWCLDKLCSFIVAKLKTPSGTIDGDRENAEIPERLSGRASGCWISMALERNKSDCPQR
jgi:hypothetical protein